MVIHYTIPEVFVEVLREQGIPEDKMPEMFRDYLDSKLCVYYGEWNVDDFKEWSEQ